VDLDRWGSKLAGQRRDGLGKAAIEEPRDRNITAVGDYGSKIFKEKFVPPLGRYNNEKQKIISNVNNTRYVTQRVR